MNVRPVLNPGLRSPWDTMPGDETIRSCQDKAWLHNELHDYDQFLEEAESRQERYQKAVVHHQIGALLSAGVGVVSLAALPAAGRLVEPGLRTALQVTAGASCLLSGISLLHHHRQRSDSLVELDSSGRDIAGLQGWKSRVQDQLQTLGKTRP